MRMRFLYVLLAFLILLGCQAEKYSSGKDTVRSFGDGTFQLLSYFDGFNRKVELVNNATDDIFKRRIDGDVKHYKKFKSEIYFIGEKYTIINIESLQIKSSSDLQFFKQEEQKIFRSIKK